MKSTKYILISLFYLVLMSRCDTIHEFPDGDTPQTKIDFTVNLTVKDVEFDSIFYTKSTSGVAEYDMRYIVEVHSVSEFRGEGELKQRIVLTRAMSETSDFNFQLSLNPQKYLLLFWVDYVKKGTQTDLYYDTQSLQAVKIMRPYQGNSDYKNAYTAVTQIDLTPYRNTADVSVSENVDLKRPFAKFKIITTDIQKYTNSKAGTSPIAMPSKIIFRYLPSVAEQYNVMTQRPERYSDSETFTTIASDFSVNECTITCDYIFMNGDSTNAAVSFDVYDQDGKLLNKVGMLQIPIKRNMYTIIRGEFLTKEFEGGDFGIDDGFDDEIVIVIPG